MPKRFSITTAEAMAIAVLKGDIAAAKALADYLYEMWEGGTKEVLPVKTLIHTKENLRAVFRTYESLGDDVIMDAEGLRVAYQRWLAGEPMLLQGIHFELYELPK